VIVHGEAEPRKPARVVLLGARGFIAGALQRGLRARGFNVLALGSSEIDLTRASATDALSAELRGSDAVVMLAALTPDKGRDIATLMKNLAMMQHLCAALERTPCAHLVYFSSDAVYPFTAGRVTEETPASPQDLYGAMHLARELMARSLTKIALLVLRPTLVYGAEDTHNAYGPNRFRRSAEKEGRIQLFGEGEETRDHIHVDDVAAITLRCLERRSTGVLNVATGVSTSFRQLADLVARRLSQPVQILGAPRANPITHRHYDITTLLKAFPDFRFVGTEDGVANG
jgi:nucleoside-diphosphate-sugar epimerase